MEKTVGKIKEGRNGYIFECKVQCINSKSRDRIFFRKVSGSYVIFESSEDLKEEVLEIYDLETDRGVVKDRCLELLLKKHEITV